MTEPSHTCAVCARRIPARLLMCWPHWQQVPRDAQRAVVKAYGDLMFGTRRQTPEAFVTYMAARKAAIDALRPNKDAAPMPTTTGEPS